MQKFLQLASSTNPYLEDDFIITASNKKPYEYLIFGDLWGVKPFDCSLLLYGAKASGKSFLAKIWQRHSDAMFLSLDQENTDYSKYPAYIIEDIEKWEEKKLLAAFNMINEAKKRLLLTSYQMQYNPGLRDLRSRINSIKTISTSVDQELLEIFIFRYFSQIGRQVSMKLVKFLAARLERNLDKALNILGKINSKASALQKPISVELARDFLSSAEKI